MDKPVFRVAVLEDQDDLREELGSLFESEGYEVAIADCAEAFDEIMPNFAADVLILDLGLPGEDGLSLLKRYTESWTDLEVVVLTAKGEMSNRIRAYDYGARGFLTKPFAIAELLAIVDSYFRRRYKAPQRFDCDGLRLTGSVVVGAAGSVIISQTEIRLLRAFAASSDRQLETYRIAEVLATGRDGPNLSKGAIELAVSRLRAKIKKASGVSHAITAVYRQGYVLNLPLKIQV